MTYCRCGDPECPIHLELAGQEPSTPYVRCRTGAQTVCTHNACKEAATRTPTEATS